MLCWSGGKDCAWCLRECSPSSLLTTFDEGTGLVPIHNVPVARIRWQASALGLPLREVALPSRCSNEEYRKRVAAALASGESMIFGDLFLRDIREFRERSFPDRELVFPLWGRDTGELAEDMIRSGLQATVTAVNRELLPESAVGCAFDRRFLAALPPGTDPCGENGEFHTFVSETWLASYR